MSIKFTLGPWSYIRHGSKFRIGPDKWLTAGYLEASGFASAEAEANARLIAAAPDLYVAALKALDVMKTGPEKDALVEALLKATAGEAK